jgi:uracil-DNA glycosylase family protein
MELYLRAAARDGPIVPPPASRSKRASLASVREEALGCRACPLFKDATQTVFGEGPVPAQLMLVGEQPGDQEDRAGHPFVGPAGRVLNEALEQAGIDRSQAFVTNGVKHFKYRQRGKRRIHQRPHTAEVLACRRWLQAEVDLVAPEVLVALGATAAYALLGRATPVSANRGRLLESPVFAAPVLVTAHPSSVLREHDSATRHASLAALAGDLRTIAGGSDGFRLESLGSSTT